MLGRLRVLLSGLAVAGLLTAALPAYGQDQRAGALALEADGQSEEAVEAWKAIAAKDAGNVEALAHLGLLEARLEHYPEAIGYYREALKLDPYIQGLQTNLGLAYFKNGQFKDAIKPFTAALHGNPGNEQLLTLLGMAHYGVGDYLVAIPYLKQAAEKQSTNLPLRLALAHSCLWSKQYDCVLATYKEILTLDPNSAEAEMLAGEAMDETGDDAGAMMHFQAAAAANPKEPNVHFSIAYLLWTQNHYPEAAKEFETELRNDPQHAEARAYLGDCHVQLNDYARAAEELRQALPAEKDSAMVHRDLGIVDAQAGKNDEAEKELLQAIALDPKDAAPHWRLARLYQAMARKDEAAAEFAKVGAMKAEAKSGSIPQAMNGASANGKTVGSQP